MRILAGLGATLAFGVACSGLPARPASDNVLIVVFDDLGIDKVAAYGVHADPPHLPVLDALADQGVRFPVAYGFPLCSPTRAALMTGRYARHTGINHPLAPEERVELPLAEETLPELLSTRGYHTGGVGKWHLGTNSSPSRFSHPWRQGFSFYTGTIGNLAGAAGDYHTWREVGADRKLHTVSGDNSTHLADVAIEFLARTPEPWFLYLSFHAPHEPFQPVPATSGHPSLPASAPTADLYDAMAENADRQLGRVLDALNPAVRARTTIVALGDNGTPGEVMRRPLHPERSKMTVYEGGVRIPLIVAGPAVVAPGRASRALVHVVDVLPTLAERVGATPRPGIDGRSFLKALADPSDPGARTTLFSQRIYPNGPGPWTLQVSTIRDAGYKLVRWRGGDESLFEVGTGISEGPDLLPTPLAPAEEAARIRLSAALEEELAR